MQHSDMVCQLHVQTINKRPRTPAVQEKGDSVQKTETDNYYTSTLRAPWSTHRLFLTEAGFTCNHVFPPL